MEASRHDDDEFLPEPGGTQHVQEQIDWVVQELKEQYQLTSNFDRHVIRLKQIVAKEQCNTVNRCWK